MGGALGREDRDESRAVAAAGLRLWSGWCVSTSRHSLGCLQALLPTGLGPGVPLRPFPLEVGVWFSPSQYCSLWKSSGNWNSFLILDD